MVTWEQVATFAQTLPMTEVQELGPEHPQPAVRFRRASIAWLREDGVNLVVKTTFEEREALMQEDPETFFVTPHYLGFPGVLVRLSSVDFDHVRELITEAWRARATKRQLREMDGIQ